MTNRRSINRFFSKICNKGQHPIILSAFYFTAVLLMMTILSGCANNTISDTSDSNSSSLSSTLNSAEPSSVSSTSDSTDATTEHSDYVVTYFKVGAADAILIQSQGTAMLIDTGLAINASNLVQQIKSLGVTSIDKLILTHFDKDHVGGASAIINAFAPGEVLVTYMSKSSNEIDAYQAALTKARLQARIVTSTEYFELGGAAYTIYAPASDDYGNNTSNDSSLVVRAIYGENSFLFAGDIEKARIKEMLDDNAIELSADILKVPHHGRYEKKSGDLLDAVSPEIAIITDSIDEPSDEEMLEELATRNIQYYFTQNGNITVTSDGINLSIVQ